MPREGYNGITPEAINEAACWDGLPRSSDDTTVMEELRRGQVIQDHNIEQLARG